MTPEAELWGAVVVVAIRDARSGDRNARAWLSLPSEDMVTVCHLAGFEPGWVRRLAVRLGCFDASPPVMPRAHRKADHGPRGRALLARLLALQGLMP